MIELTRMRASGAPTIKVLGLGGAGCNILDRLILDGFDVTQTVALNTDLQALNGSVAPEKVHLGKATTRGLGAGGDPELGYSAAEEAADDIAAAIGSSDMVFVCTGLGGGTGSGAAPLVAHLARKAGATVIGLVTMPFNFEGKRRGAQAAEALAQLEQQAHIVLCFENDAMGSIVAPTAGIQQAFVATDQTLSQGIRALVGMVSGRGLVNIGLDDLTAAFGRGGMGTRCLFGYGESDSPNRSHEAIERALRSPLMDKGRMLSEAQQVIVHVAGGTELTLNEVTVLMEEFNRHIAENTRVSFGVSCDAKLGRKINVALLCANTTAAEPVAAAKVSQSVPVAPLPERKPAPPAIAPSPVVKEEFFDVDELPPVEPVAEPARQREPEPVPVAKKEAVTKAAPAPAPVSAPASAVVSPAAKKYAPAAAVAASTKTNGSKKEERAEQMTLEPANRGRFEKSEPTIVDGEDLDVPTFLRKTARR